VSFEPTDARHPVGRRRFVSDGFKRSVALRVSIGVFAVGLAVALSFGAVGFAIGFVALAAIASAIHLVRRRRWNGP
jgi:4-hydroxybenzoate polyprenyltransferase